MPEVITTDARQVQGAPQLADDQEMKWTSGVETGPLRGDERKYAASIPDAF